MTIGKKSIKIVAKEASPLFQFRKLNLKKSTVSIQKAVNSKETGKPAAQSTPTGVGRGGKAGGKRERDCEKFMDAYLQQERGERKDERDVLAGPDVSADSQLLDHDPTSPGAAAAGTESG